jgi:hypothetical protein
LSVTLVIVAVLLLTVSTVMAYKALTGPPASVTRTVYL